MTESKFAEYWTQAEACYFKAETAKGPVAKHLWIQLAQDWIALAEPLVPQPDRLIYQVPTKQLEPLEQMEPFLVA
ncbi:MAG: hypothetical protein Q7T25_14390 [Sideroxyarcus sp.]|nr:hypothetical protein [Sideroxyarcus sp.]